MGSLRQDIRFALRTLLKRPGFTAIAVLTIAIGVAACTSIFSVVNGVLLRPLPVHEPERLVQPDVIGPTGFEISLSIPNFKDWRDRNRTFETFGATAGRSRTLTGGDRPEVLSVRLILGDWFESLGVSPALGRLIPAEETFAGAAPEAVLMHWFWEKNFGGDETAIGRTITLDGEAFTVVGVMPEDFLFPFASTAAFLPMGYFSENMCWEIRGCSQGTWALGRLKNGVTPEAAQADLDRIHAELEEEEGGRVARAEVHSLTHQYVGDVQAQIWILMGAVGFVLLIACANVANLLLAKGEARRREVALRTALGARRGRVIRQFLTESTVLALAGGVLGIALSFVGIRLLVPLVSEDVPSIMVGSIGIDVTVLVFTLGATVAAGLLFGIAPALRAAKPDLVGELKEGGRGTAGKGRQRLRSGLVIVEVALSLVLLIGAGLMLQSLRQLESQDKGFDETNVFTGRVALPRVKYDDQDKAWAFYDELLRRVQALPGAQRVSLSQLVPLQGNSWEQGIVAEGVEIIPENFRSVLYHMVTPDHFETLGIPLLMGRAFTDADRNGTGDMVCIIDETMAEMFWPDENPIGKRVTFEAGPDATPDDPQRIYRTVVGVTGNVRHYEIEAPSRIQVYVPMLQSGTNWSNNMHVIAKTAGDPLALTALVRAEVSALDRDVPLADVQTMESYVDEAMSGTRSVGTLLATFSVIAMLLSAIGIFGVMSFSVVQRIREIGIRMALGAKSGDVVRMVSRQGLVLTTAGVLVGLLGAFGLSRVLANILYQVDPVEPVMYGGFAVFLISISMLAAYLPARRATRVDPAIVLREE